MSGQGAGRSTDTQPAFNYGYFVVLSSFLIMLVLYGVYYAFGVFFKPAFSEFGWSRALTSGAFSLSSIMMGLLGIPMGALTDRFGPRLVLTLCGLLIGLGFFLMSRLNTVWQLYLFFGLFVGIGMGGSFVPMASAIARWFTERRGVMTGIITAGIGLGALIGPPLADRLISNYGWREAYVILGLMVWAVVILSAQFLKAGPVLESRAAGHGHEEPKGGLNQEREGLSFRQAARTSQFWLAFGMFVCFGFCLFSIMVHIVPHVIDLGIQPSSAAKVLAGIGGVSIVGKVIFGRLDDIIGSKRVFIISFILMSASLFWLVPAKKMWMLYSMAVIFGLAYGGNVVAMSPLTATLFGLTSHGVILGFFSFSFTIGGAIGPFLTGYMFDVTGGYGPAFLCCAILSTVGLGLTAALKPINLKA